MGVGESVVQDIISRLLSSRDYRVEIVNLINEDFLQHAIAFFKQVIEAKQNNKNISVDWYKSKLLNKKLSKEEIAINSGLNMKTINNMYNSTKREIVLDSAHKHYLSLSRLIDEIASHEKGLNIFLTIRLDGTSVDLTLKESLLVINTLAVKRAQLRGGLWSSAGKQVEKPLMLVLCALYGVSKNNYSEKLAKDSKREVDFYLLQEGKEYKCEVKLMGKGNPESADGAIARDSDVFVADKLSDSFKKHLSAKRIEWVELRSEEGYKRFEKILSRLNIPHKKYDGNVDKDLPSIIKGIF